MTDREDAASLFRKAVERHTRGELAEALTLYGAAIRLAPDLPAAHSNRGAVLNAMKRFDLALRSCDRALECDHDFADAWSNRGNALEGLGRADEAVQSYQRAIFLKPDYPAAHNNRGNALRNLGRRQEALESYDAAIALAPDYAEAHYNRGIALKDLKRVDNAIASYDRAIALKPDYAEPHNNRGNVLQEQERLEEALASYDRALALKPNYPEAWNNRGVTLRCLKRLDDALESFDRAIALVPEFGPEFGDTQWNKSLCLLQMGRIEEGWRLYEWRLRRADPNIPRPLPGRLWNGEENIAGKTLLIQAEQGLGDTIQFCRYAKLAEAAGAKVVFAVQDVLARLVKTLSPTVQLIDSKSSAPDFDFYVPLLNLPRAFKTRASDSPATVPYLHAESDKVSFWRERIGNAGFRIGICWQGERSGGSDIGRSFPVRLFESISRIPRVRLISLQKTAGVEQLRDLPPGMAVETLGDDFDSGPDAFVDSAAAMENLDLVITSDTAIAHLAGALGHPVWLALKHVPDWRWFLDGPDSPWYPTMRLFRQTSRGDWPGVFADMECALGELMETRRSRTPATPRVPVSWGELIDKLTILEIKSERIAGDTARANIRNELAALQELAGPLLADGDKMKNLATRLRAINEELWDTENRIRAKDAAAEFDREFVTLARAVYTRNDERARIKREINLVLGSEFVEEKSYK